MSEDESLQDHDFKLYVKLALSMIRHLEHFVRGNDTISSRAVYAAAADLLVHVAKSSGAPLAQVMASIRDTYQCDSSREKERQDAERNEQQKRSQPQLYLPRPLR